MIVNVKKIKEYMDDLVEYDEYLPTLIRFLVDEKYYTNLTKANKIDKVLERINETRKYSYTEQLKELKDWCKDNEEFQDIIQ